MIEISDVDRMLNTGGSYKYSNGLLSYQGVGNLGGLVDDRFNSDYLTYPPDVVNIELPELVLKGYGRAKHWGGAISTYNINHNIIYNGIVGVQNA